MSSSTYSIPALLLILCITITSSELCIASDPVGDVTLCGLSRLNITPEEPVTLAGYGSRKGLSEGIHDSLFVRVLAFQQGDDKLVLISTDVIGFYSGTAAIIRESIVEQTGLKPSEIFLSAIHTHAAPSIILDAEKGHKNNVKYTRNLNHRINEAIGLAMSTMQPVQFAIGTGSSPVGVNRREVYYNDSGNPRTWLGRNPDGVSDREVQVLEIKNQAKTKAVMWDYATHSTSLGPKNYQVSGDIHGLAEQFIEEYLGDDIIAPAFVGASGDMDPWYRVLPGFKTDKNWVPEPVLMGTLLGEEVIHILQNMDELTESHPINSVFKTVTLPAKTYGEMTVSEDDTTSEFNISVARLGDIAFVGLGGEVLSEIGLAIKAASPFNHTFVITHCNGAAGYLVPKHRFNEQGYEVRSSPFAPDAADMVVKRVLELLYALWSE